MSTRSVMSLVDWKLKARAGEAPDALLRKQFVADSVKAEGKDSRKVAFTISTGAVDRDHDTLAPDGWRLDAYRKNPVVLWAHESRGLPIAFAEYVNVVGGALKARADFVTAEENPLAEQVLRLLRRGVLNATSVGFIPNYQKAKWDDERCGFDFGEQELIEFSVVPVPANPEALQDAKAAGEDIGLVLAWAERVLDEGKGSGLWVPKAQAEAAIKALAEPRIVVPAGHTYKRVGNVELVEPAFTLTVSNVVKVLQSATTKAGRTLSAANEERLRTALKSIETSADGIDAAAEAIEEVLDLAAPAPAEEPKAAPPAHAIKLRAEPREKRIPVTADEVRGVTVAALEGLVGAEIRRHTGRLE